MIQESAHGTRARVDAALGGDADPLDRLKGRIGRDLVVARIDRATIPAPGEGNVIGTPTARRTGPCYLDPGNRRGDLVRVHQGRRAAHQPRVATAAAR